MSKPIQSLTGTLQKRNQVGGSIAISMLHGKSAYEIAVANGFVGTEEEWIESLKGDAATIELGTVTYGVPTSITNSGDETHAVFDFVLPTGDNASSEVAGVMKLYDNPGYNKDGSMTQATTTTMLGNKVDKVEGKGLSTNDYTTEEKNKLANIEANADVNIIESVKVNGTALAPDVNKAVDITVPTKTSEITNDSNFAVDANYVHTDNNYTTTEKNKLNAIDEGANNYELPKASIITLGGIKVGTNLSIDADGVLSADARKMDVDSAMSSTSENPVQNKVVNTALGLKAPLASPALTGTPTAPTATAGTNTDQIATTKFVTSAVSTAIGDLAGVEFSVVNALPATGDTSIIYLISASDGSGNDVYDEYIWLTASATFEKIGSTRVDLSNYYNKEEVDALVAKTEDDVEVLNLLTEFGYVAPIADADDYVITDSDNNIILG